MNKKGLTDLFAILRFECMLNLDACNQNFSLSINVLFLKDVLGVVEYKKNVSFLFFWLFQTLGQSLQDNDNNKRPLGQDDGSKV